MGMNLLGALGKLSITTYLTAAEFPNPVGAAAISDGIKILPELWKPSTKIPDIMEKQLENAIRDTQKDPEVGLSGLRYFDFIVELKKSDLMTEVQPFLEQEIAVAPQSTSVSVQVRAQSHLTEMQELWQRNFSVLLQEKYGLFAIAANAKANRFMRGVQQRMAAAIKEDPDTLILWISKELEKQGEKLDGIHTDTQEIKADTQEIKTGIEALHAKIAAPAQTLHLPAPLPPVPLVAREEDLDKFERFVEDHPGAVAISAVGGLGKTEFLRRYLQQYAKGVTVGWLSYNDNPRATLLNTPGLVQNSHAQPGQKDVRWEECLRLLSALPAGSLLVLDGVDALPTGQNRQDFLALLSCQNLRLLLTTRLPENSFGSRVAGYPLPPVSAKGCQALFAQYSGTPLTELPPKERKALDELIDRVGRHSLALELLAKTCAAGGRSVAQIYNRVVESGFTLADVEETVQSENDEARRRFAEHMDKLYDIAGVAALGAAEQGLLRNLCLLPLENFKSETLKGWLKLSGFEALNELERWGWLRQTKTGAVEQWRVTQHPVLREVLWRQLKPTIAECATLTAALKKVTEYQENDPQRYQPDYLPQACGVASGLNREETVPEHPGEEEAAVWLELASLCHNVGSLLYYTADYEQALTYYGKALAIKEKVLGPEHPDTATTYNDMAGVYYARGNYEQALTYYRKALAIREKVPGPEHPATAATYNNMAGVYDARGNYEQALAYYDKALAIYEKVPGPEHPDTAMTYNNMAIVYRAQGNDKQALTYSGKALAIYEKVLGPEHPDTASTYNNMAGVYYARGDYEQALTYYDKALAIYEKVLGPEHPNTAGTYNNMAVVYDDQGNYEQALTYYDKALAICEKVLGPEHPNTAMTYANIGVLLDAQSDFAAAQPWLVWAHHVYLVRLGADHPQTQKSLRNLRQLHQDLKVSRPFEEWLSAAVEAQTQPPRLPPKTKSLPS